MNHKNFNSIVLALADETSLPKGVLIPTFSGNAFACPTEEIGAVSKSRKDWWIADFPVLNRKSDE